MRREKKLEVMEDTRGTKTTPKFELGKNYTAPNSVVESGVVRLVCHEWGADNKHLGGKEWYYSAVPMPTEVLQTPDIPVPSFTQPFMVTETELLKTWKAQPYKWATS